MSFRLSGLTCSAGARLGAQCEVVGQANDSDIHIATNGAGELPASERSGKASEPEPRRCARPPIPRNRRNKEQVSTQ